VSQIVKELRKALSRCGTAGAAFPNYGYTPPHRKKGDLRNDVPMLICCQLVLPKSLIARRRFRQFTSVSMPKTTMDKHRYAPARQNNVWMARQQSRFLAKPESTSVQAPSNFNFWSCIFSADTGHHATANRSTYDVWH
jgi:hypothetical protein